LKADVSEAGAGWSDSRIIKLWHSVSWFTGSESNWWKKGFEAVLSRKQRDDTGGCADF